MPVYGMCVYWQKKRWDGTLSLLSLYKDKDARAYGNRVLDYQVTLVAPSALSDETICQLRTALREIFLYIKHSNRIEDLRRIVRSDLYGFKNLDPSIAMFINQISGSRFKLKNYVTSTGGINMCKAVDDMRQQTKEYRVKNAELRRGIRELNHNNKELTRNNKELKREKQALVSLLQSKGMSQSEINTYLASILN